MWGDGKAKYQMQSLWNKHTKKAVHHTMNSFFCASLKISICDFHHFRRFRRFHDLHDSRYEVCLL